MATLPAKPLAVSGGSMAVVCDQGPFSRMETATPPPIPPAMSWSSTSTSDQANWLTRGVSGGLSYSSSRHCPPSRPWMWARRMEDSSLSVSTGREEPMTAVVPSTTTSRPNWLRCFAGRSVPCSRHPVATSLSLWNAKTVANPPSMDGVPRIACLPERPHTTGGSRRSAVNNSPESWRGSGGVDWRLGGVDVAVPPVPAEGEGASLDPHHSQRPW
jgi:hypothetical protein